MSTPVEIIGHRGAPRAYTENTLASFRCALEGGATAIELDVHATADGVVVVHHDARLSAPHLGRRDAGPAIASLDRAALAALESDRQEHIPDLAEVLRLAGDATVYVEVKAPAIEERVVETIRAGAARCAVHSFDHRVARRVRELAPETPVGILSASYLLDPAATLRSAGARDYWQQWELIDAALVSRVHEAGGRVIAWTVNDPAAAEALVAMGVDALCTDVTSDFVRIFT